MRTFKQLCDGKVWKAIDFMIKGLKAVKDIPHREVDMGSFGFYSPTDGDWYKGKICYGCAATAACEAASGIIYDQDNIFTVLLRAKASNVDSDDLNTFESAIDGLRMGIWWIIFRYMDEEAEEVRPEVELEELEDDWEEHIHLYEAYRDQLKKLDI